MTKLQYPLCGPQVCLQRAACLTCLIYSMIFDKIWLNIKCVFSTTFVWNISHPKKKWARHCHKCKSPVIRDILMKLEHSRPFFFKYSSIEISENPSRWSTRADGRTDGQTHMTKLIVAFATLLTRPQKATRFWILQYKYRGADKSLARPGRKHRRFWISCRTAG